MYLVEQHIIDKSHELWKECDQLCFASKNLYNYSLYKIKEYQEKNNNKLPSGYDLYHIVKGDKCFKELPVNSAQGSIFQAVDMCKYFYKAIKSFKKKKGTFTGCPKPPKYKHKTKGRNVLTIPIRNCRLKDGHILFNKNLNLKLKTKVTNLVEVKVVPQSGCYLIQVCYQQESKPLLTTNKKIAIDLGVNNIITVSNNFNEKPLIINGKPLKSVNQYYNKKQAELKSKLPKFTNDKGEVIQRSYSNKIQSLTNKRDNKVKWLLHNYSRYLITYCQQHQVSQIAIGYNEGWKQDINIGKRNNQKFTYIPFRVLITQIQYKAELQGIAVLLNEESYTSKCSALDLEPICKHDEYKGKRVKRGLFKTATGKYINADLNGSLNIGRKVFGDDYIKFDTGCVVHPVKVTPL